MKLFDRIFAPKFQPVFPISFREEERSICSRCLCFYQGAYGCTRCQREILDADYPLEERLTRIVNNECPHCREPLQDDKIHVASYCRSCQQLSNENWISLQNLRVIALPA